MPDPVYDRLVATGNRLIGQFGKPVDVLRNVRTGGAAHNPTLTQSTLAVKFVETMNAITDRINTNVKTNDIIGLVSMDGETATLESTDRIRFADGAILSVIDLQPLDPGGLQILTEVHLRK